MTNEQINEAIAEACGWDLFPWEVSGEDGWNQWVRSPSGELCFYEGSIPDYCNDLNAMHEAWLSLSLEDKFGFDRQLQRVLLTSEDGTYWLTNATARQRAEAFLKTLGKWEDIK
jgi:hypothetical protein